MNADPRLATAGLDLKTLLETCNDGAEGYRQAAQDVRDPRLKPLLEQFAAERDEFAAELRKLIVSCGEQCTAKSSFAAGLHRDWINIKSVFYPQPEEAVLAECERGEDAAIEKYEHVLDGDLPEEIAEIVSRQLQSIETARAHIRDWRERIEAE